jgi:hypothetical protein
MGIGRIEFLEGGKSSINLNGKYHNTRNKKIITLISEQQRGFLMDYRHL